jgi:GntR family transcriptional regulator
LVRRKERRCTSPNMKNMDLGRSIDRENVIPLYHQIKESIKGKILDEELKPGEQIPSEAELCSIYKVSRGTVRNAINDLVTDGILYREHGRGTFVAKPKIEQSLVNFYTFFGDMPKQGYRPSKRLIKMVVEPAYRSVARSLSIKNGTSVIHARILKEVNNEPFLLESLYVSYELCPKLLDADIETVRLYDFIDEEGITLYKSAESFEPILIDEFTSEILGVPVGAPGLAVERIVYAIGDLPVVLHRGVVRGDRCKYHVELFRAKDEMRK